MSPGDYVILNDVMGCVQSVEPLTLLCTDGKVREFKGTPTIMFTAQQIALLYAEKTMNRIKGVQP